MPEVQGSTPPAEFMFMWMRPDTPPKLFGTLSTSWLSSMEDEAIRQGFAELRPGSLLQLVARQLLCAVAEPYRVTETVVTAECAGQIFSAKGKTVLAAGWKTYLDKDTEDKVIPDVAEGMELPVQSAKIKEGTTKPPAHHTEDSILHAMETAGLEDMPEDAERKGLGTPATRAGILEKLVANGFIERKKAQKTVHLIPTHGAVSLITVLPEQLQSPLLTAEWEHRLKQIEHGELAADDFLADITEMVTDLVRNYHAVKGAEVLFPSGREVVGKCPRCGGDVIEAKKGFFCECGDCWFSLWRDNKFFQAKHIRRCDLFGAEKLCLYLPTPHGGMEGFCQRTC